ncbi:eCIS core domain-containing protein [Halomonas maura]|uniref:eCIS core domain-containing protein n=1 Tax=Halomonas maura TaxID=117606 RepID=UPI0025B45468|nr:DUF4157 domain-containing protein [Halomonas maura]MDN3556274.1 DUF4157 domain-containing protein [Halomonas maura]
MTRHARHHPAPHTADVQTGLLQRRCACGGAASPLTGECEECRRDATPGLQRRLAIGRRDDPLEQEADRAAARVLQGQHAEPTRGTPPRLSRRGAQTATPDATAPRSVHRTLQRPGEPLPGATRAFFEPRFGHDFGRVRIHHDAAAAGSARDVDALAYTVGRDVVFGQGQYAPHRPAGRELIAHELAHVVQQSEQAPHRLQRRAIHDGDILFEGTCEFLACNSKWACEDADNGVACADGTRNAHSETGKRYRPLFTCDTRCENNRTCEDDGNWMAIPSGRFARSKCGQDLVICANGHFTHGSVRDRSSGEHWEVSPGIIDRLDVARGTFTGAIYGSESDQAFLRDSRCRPSPETDTEPGSRKGGDEDNQADEADTPAEHGNARDTRGASGARRVYSLTFDDGPHAAPLGGGNNRTEKVLDTLQDKSATAGFFVQTHALSGEGRPLRGNTPVGRQLIRRMRADGHAIGIHTGGTIDHESHPSAQAAGRLQSELETARSFIRETTATPDQAGVEATLVRPPYGRSNEAVEQTYQNLNLTNLLWDIDGDPRGEMSLADLKTQVAAGIRRIAANNWRVSTPAAPKIVILYHDIRRNTSSHLGDVMEHIEQVTHDIDGSSASFERP